ncbi:2-octaprenyl-6-methoxyphenyl hydroxylase [Candidatus Erwinia haradaeae]|uniref:2-octaprenyl-6-methoxyphenol hydroxylase n=1 Tax=Candidatus Erwinia haradaeae TaxID=1922217 RepID=A0A451D3Q0_9GAMM|nr:2-octaprenyl-6-methoxyphenyl hydroxylase [Candidatus Erwinia haradaeae]VFP80302.1 2-octaprenyl-6-methoxyphenol hydroxylase [Candidatus Erwinia haradaeae]
MSIIIVGGGIVGSTLALAISYITKGTKQIFLIAETEPKDFLSSKKGGKIIAISEDTCQKIASFNLWSIIESISTKITHIHISDRGSLGFISLDARERNIPSLGRVIELSRAIHTLFSCIKKAPGLTLYCPHTVSQVKRLEKYVSITLDNGKKINGELLVAADGLHSNIAKICGIKKYSINYKQIAVTSTISTQFSHNGWAFERFTDQGPLAMLPVSHGCSALIWCQSHKNYEKIMQWNDKKFLFELQNIFGWQLGRLLETGKRMIYPLHLHSVEQNISHRLVLIGDAAQTLHPIAGQGFNLGMRDIQSLVDTLQQAWENGKKAGEYSTLKFYQNLRKKDVRNTIKITNELVRIFSNQHKGLIIGRSLSLMIIDQIPLLRNLLTQWVLGSMQWNIVLKDKKNETL